MDKFVPYEKMSKKEKRAYDAKQRRGWGQCSPESRIHPDKKAYRRHAKHRHAHSEEECTCMR